MAKASINFKLKPHQLKAYESETRFEVRVWARRSGKTFYTIARQVARCIQAPVKDWRAYYIAPTRVQAKGITWSYLTAWLAGLPGVEFNIQELSVNFPNGSRLQLLGGEQYDTIRGRWIDDAVFDECAHIPSPAWTQVVSPALADRKGRCTFTGTPNGRHNLLHEMHHYAQTANDPEWSTDVLDVYEAGMVDDVEITRLKRQLDEAEFNQEMLCSWSAAMRGAYYAKLMERAERENRIIQIDYDDAWPVQVAVDLGWSDGMACTFWQKVGTQHRCIMAKEYHATAIPEIVQDWKAMPFPIDTVILPHDANVHELGTGLTRQEVFHSMGCKTVVAPRQPVHEGIEQVRQILKSAAFDATGAAPLIEALLSYRSSYDEVKGVHSMKPLHDWSSHLADSARYYATGRQEDMMWSEQPRGNFGIYA